jgi:hypothetical protein
MDGAPGVFHETTSTKQDIPQGLKPDQIRPFSARLKPCPFKAQCMQVYLVLKTAQCSPFMYS